MRRSDLKRPSERRIGARVRIKPDFQNEVEALFAAANVFPIYKDLREDGNVSYWFGKEQQAELAGSGVLERIPLHHWAHYAIIGEPPTLN